MLCLCLRAGIAPDRFWKLGLPELLCVCAAFQGAPLQPDVLRRNELEALMDQMPDKPLAQTLARPLARPLAPTDERPGGGAGDQLDGKTESR